MDDPHPQPIAVLLNEQTSHLHETSPLWRLPGGTLHPSLPSLTPDWQLSRTPQHYIRLRCRSTSTQHPPPLRLQTPYSWSRMSALPPALPRPNANLPSPSARIPPPIPRANSPQYLPHRPALIHRHVPHRPAPHRYQSAHQHRASSWPPEHDHGRYPAADRDLSKERWVCASPLRRQPARILPHPVSGPTLHGRNEVI